MVQNPIASQEAAGKCNLLKYRPRKIEESLKDTRMPSILSTILAFGLTVPALAGNSAD
jgi:hypothetical protein